MHYHLPDKFAGVSLNTYKIIFDYLIAELLLYIIQIGKFYILYKAFNGFNNSTFIAPPPRKVLK